VTRTIQRLIRLLLAAGLAGTGCRPAPDDLRRTPVVKAVEGVMPSVVNIGTARLVKTMHDDPFHQFRGRVLDRYFSDFFSPPAPPEYKLAHSLGSGVLIHEDGYILTNYHVIERASVIQVTLADETSYPARVVAGDEISDLALIKVDSPAPLPAAPLAADDDLLLGETVVVLGNPYGLAHTVTVGVLSAKNREARHQGEVLFRDILQTDAAVNPGSSGGPMLNVNGEVIGINVAIYQEAQNIGFAVPVARVRRRLADWLQPDLLHKRWPGFRVAESPEGPVVTALDGASGAARAGIREGDRIVAVNGNPVRSRFDFGRAAAGIESGETMRVDVKGAGGTLRAELAMEPLPKPSGTRLALSLLGLEIAESGGDEDPGLSGRGVLIRKVLPDSAAERLGLRAGYYVQQINGTPVRGADDVGLALKDARAGDPVELTVLRIFDQGAVVVVQRHTVRMTAGASPRETT